MTTSLDAKDLKPATPKQHELNSKPLKLIHGTYAKVRELEALASGRVDHTLGLLRSLEGVEGVGLIIAWEVVELLKLRVHRTQESRSLWGLWGLSIGIHHCLGLH